MPAVDLTPYYQPQGSTSDGSKYDNGLALIQSTLNGLDNNNFAAGKIFDPSKLMQNSAVDGDGLVWDGTAMIWKRTTDKPLRIGALAGYPADGTKVLKGDGTWGTAGGATTYRKATAKAVNTTIAATDLLNAEITVGAGVLGATGKARLTANGDWLQNAAAGVVMPRFQLVLGGVTLIDTGANTRAAGQSATRTMWRLVAEITNTATNAQNVVFLLEIAATLGGTSAVTTFTTGTGVFDTGTTASVSDMRNYAKGYNTAAVDTTASKALVLNVINGSNSASYETKLFDALVEII